MKNVEVLEKFLNDEQGKTTNLTSTRGQLINYTTTIAEKVGNTIYLNTTKFSKTTSTIQNKLRYLATQKGFAIVECTKIL